MRSFSFDASKNIILSYGFVSDEDKILKFLEEIHKIPFANYQEWEPKIFEFFKEPHIVTYIASTNEENNFYPTEKIIKDTMKKLQEGTYFWDSNVCYEALNKIYDSLKTGTRLREYSEFFFLNNVIIRKILLKQTDQEDKAFEEYSCRVSHQESVSGNANNLWTRRIYYLQPDASLTYPLEKYRGKVTKDINEAIYSVFPKKIPYKKRRKLDSRLRHEVFKRDGYKCKECGASKEDKMLHADHIIPFSKGGTDELENLQTLCDDCNLAKSDKTWRSE